MRPRPDRRDDILDPDLLGILLELRLVGLSDVRSAADRVIAEADEPPELAIELSLATDLAQVMELVRPYPAVRPPQHALAEGLKCLRDAVEAGSLDVGDATARFYRFATKYFGCYHDVCRAGVAWLATGELRTGETAGTLPSVRQEFARDLSRLEAGLWKRV